MSQMLLIPAVIIAAIIAIALVYAALYKKVPRGIALVRTGMGGRKVVIDGGCIVLPVFHEVRKVNLSTLKLSVSRSGDDALITLDSLRVDVTVDFYISVEELDDSIAQAARTLGDRTFDPVALRELIEGKLVDALRAVAAEQEMMNLHQNRQNFVQSVQEIVLADLKKNGLQLESVSLTGLDQTSTDNLNPNNMFNATALRITAERVTEESKKRAEAEANRKIADAQEAARAEQETVKSEETVERSRIEKERQVSVFRSQSESESRQAQTKSQREAELAELEKDENLRARGIERDRNLEISEQERRIAVASKSESESEAAAKAEEARQKRVMAEEAVQTAREKAAADRAKSIAVTQAQEQAEVEATGIRVAAEARREAAEQDKEASKSRAEALRVEKAAEAEGITAINTAKNMLSDRMIKHAERLRELDVTPQVLREMVAPFAGVGKNMKSIFLNGLGGGAVPGTAQGAGASTGGQQQSMMGDLFNNLMSYQMIGPALKNVGDGIGIDLAETLKNGSLKRIEKAETASAEEAQDDAEGVSEEVVAASKPKAEAADEEAQA